MNLDPIRELYSNLKKPFLNVKTNFQLCTIKENINLNTNQGKNIVSFSLYGYNKRYFSNLTKCLESYNKEFPSWIPRIYVSQDLPDGVIELLVNFNCEIVKMLGKSIDSRYMLWRFLVLDDVSVENVMIRDIDSVASNREKRMVSEWLESTYDLHIIRDHPNHQHLIMGGMWGMKVHGIKHGIGKQIMNFKKKNEYSIDQKFLEGIYWEYATNCMIHDSCMHFEMEERIVIPHDDTFFFIGEINDDVELKRQHRSILQAFYAKSN